MNILWDKCRTVHVTVCPITVWNKISKNAQKKGFNIFLFFISFFPVPPNFNRPGGVGDNTSPPGFAGDVRDVILNNPISLYCETNAVPPPTLTWYKDGQLLTSSDKVLILPGKIDKKNWNKSDRECVNTNLFFFSSGGRVLQIPRAQAEDTGRYTCVAVNEAGEDSIQYDVRVLCEYKHFFWYQSKSF